MSGAPVEPRPAASVVLVRPAPAGAPEPIEVYVIRRHRGLRFLGGFYAFPGGKVDAADASPEVVERCRGLTPAEAATLCPGDGQVAPLAFWVTAVRELLEETGVLLACDAAGRPIDTGRPAVVEAIAASRRALVTGEAPFGALLAGAGWFCDLRPLRYLSHFITPRASPIRFTARFFLGRTPAGQQPALFTEEISEGFWIQPAEGLRRFRAGEMAMAEPAEYGLAYVAQFASVDDLWAAHGDGRHKFHGIVDRIEFWEGFDWAAARGSGAPR